MTKYRAILRLTALGPSIWDIEKSPKVSRKTVVKVQKRENELSLHWPLDKSLIDVELGNRCSQKTYLRNPRNGCLTSPTSTRSCSKMASIRSSPGQNTSKNAARMVKMPWCIPSSAITFSKTSKRGALPCSSWEKLPKAWSWLEWWSGYWWDYRSKELYWCCQIRQFFFLKQTRPAAGLFLKAPVIISFQFQLNGPI